MLVLCTICSDIVNQSENIYTTECGHIFHYDCLNTWIKRSKSCPQCRNKVTEKCMFRIFPTVSDQPSGENHVASLQSKLDAAQLQIRQQGLELKNKEENLTKALADIKKNEELLKSLEKKLVRSESAVAALKDQLEYIKTENREVKKLKEDNESLKKNLQVLQGLQKIFNATAAEVEQMLEGYTDLRTVATFATALKKALYESESKNSEIRDQLVSAKSELGAERKISADWQAKFVQLEKNNLTLEKNYKALKNKLNKPKDLDTTCIEDKEDSWHSMLKARISKSPRNAADETIVLNDSSNLSLNSMIKKIENAESPYLNLKQSSLALSTLQRPSTSMAKIATTKMTQMKNKDLDISIFHKKDSASLQFREQRNLENSELDISYDGLGGHSKLDKFPVPSFKSKSSIPKLSAKHKLKRPVPEGTRDIGQMLKKIRDK